MEKFFFKLTKAKITHSFRINSTETDEILSLQSPKIIKWVKKYLMWTINHSSTNSGKKYIKNYIIFISNPCVIDFYKQVSNSIRPLMYQKESLNSDNYQTISNQRLDLLLNQPMESWVKDSFWMRLLSKYFVLLNI